MNAGRIASIHRYPVKSLQGEGLESTLVDESGLLGDRAWAVRNETRGGIQGAKQIPELMRCSARYLDEPQPNTAAPAPEIMTQDGAAFRANDPDAHTKLSKQIGQPVTLWPLLPADVLDHYRRLPADSPNEDFEASLRALFAREPDEPLPDIGKFPPELLEFETPPGTYFDAYPLLLVTQKSLDTMAARAPESRFDVRRFRPNFVIEGAPGEGHPELGWEGKRLKIGEAILSLEIECPRCVMTTHGFDDLPKDPQIMRSLVKETGGNLGIYARVEKPGTISLGDELVLL